MLRVYNKDSIVYKGNQVEKAKDNVVSFVFFGFGDIKFDGKKGSITVGKVKS